jgi:23S rRNA (adenine2503-C2)-methyltransferase
LLRLADGERRETVLIPGPDSPDAPNSPDAPDKDVLPKVSPKISPKISPDASPAAAQEYARENAREASAVPGHRMTQCLSSQAGCAMGCTFCSTGERGFTRNLTQAEILGQILVARHLLGDTLKREILRNLVFMGMGEPLMNFAELTRSLQTLNSDLGLGFSPRRITVSTCGIKNRLIEFGQNGLAYLALSLHATDQDLRAKIMPAAAQWPLPELLQTLESYTLGNREKLTFEYLLLGGINDSIEQAKALGQIARRLKAKVNLIAYNPAAGSKYSAPTWERLLAFEKILWDIGVIAVLRKSKGQDIQAACGQLRAEYA